MIVRCPGPVVLSVSFIQVLSEHPGGDLGVVAASPCDIFLRWPGIPIKDASLVPVHRVDLKVPDVEGAVGIGNDLTVLAILDAGNGQQNIAGHPLPLSGHQDTVDIGRLDRVERI